MLNVKYLLDFMKAHMESFGTPVPITDFAAHAWAEQMGLKKGGETIVYTGLLYQLVPFIDATVKYLEVIDKTKQSSGILKLISTLAKMDLGNVVSALVPKDKIERQHKILKSIVKLLMKVNANIGYLYSDDIYPGVLFYDFGYDEELNLIARRIFNSLTQNSVKKVITIDPHTTHMLRNVLPQFEEKLKMFEVVNYLEFIDVERGNLGLEVTIHDPCYYARYSDIRAQPRALLSKIGVKVKEVKRSGENTFCCGGPIEALSPNFSKKVSEMRLNELRNASKIVVTMCPICFANLNRVNNDKNKVTIVDIAELLGQGLGV